jgi:hypothetical protein
MPCFPPQSITSYMVNDVFVRPHKFPAFVISTSFKPDAPQYGLSTNGLAPDSLTPEAMDTFIQSFLAGQLQPSRRSEPVRSVLCARARVHHNPHDGGRP